MRDMNAKRLLVTMTDGTVLHGFINIGSARRLSDFLRKDDSLFLVLFETVKNDSREKGVFILNKNHIVMVQPDETASAPLAEEPIPGIAGDPD
ncbi:MAG: hypothetical protein LLG06_05575 [Desulfobacteraceae bacterium]|nr:hypothetical protein [Desulfobacteraceae bacterium]